MKKTQKSHKWNHGKDVVTDRRNCTTFTKLKLTTFLVCHKLCLIGKHELILSCIDYSLSRGKCLELSWEKNHEYIYIWICCKILHKYVLYYRNEKSRNHFFDNEIEDQFLIYLIMTSTQSWLNNCDSLPSAVQNRPEQQMILNDSPSHF